MCKSCAILITHSEPHQCLCNQDSPWVKKSKEEFFQHNQECVGLIKLLIDSFYFAHCLFSSAALAQTEKHYQFKITTGDLIPNITLFHTIGSIFLSSNDRSLIFEIISSVVNFFDSFQAYCYLEFIRQWCKQQSIHLEGLLTRVQIPKKMMQLLSGLWGIYQQNWLANVEDYLYLYKLYI